MKEEKDIKLEEVVPADETVEKAGETVEKNEEGGQNVEAEDYSDDDVEVVAEPEEKDPLQAAQEENVKLRDQLLRTIAEFENYKKRTLKEKTELILNGGEKAISAVLPVLDDFERALADTHTDDAESIKEGMDLIFKKFVKTLEGLGLHKIETDDCDFNVDFHEAVAMVPGMGDDKKGKVIDCLQTGYMLNDKVIRHAKVAVGQ